MLGMTLSQRVWIHYFFPQMLPWYIFSLSTPSDPIKFHYCVFGNCSFQNFEKCPSVSKYLWLNVCNRIVLTMLADNHNALTIVSLWAPVLSVSNLWLLLVLALLTPFMCQNHRHNMQTNYDCWKINIRYL